MPKENARVEQFVAQLEAPLDQVVANLRVLLHELTPEAKESIKWRSVHYELNGDLCMLVPAEGYIRLAFFQGADLPDPFHTLEGSGEAGGRHVKIADPDRAGTAEIGDLIKSAVRLNASGS